MDYARMSNGRRSDPRSAGSTREPKGPRPARMRKSFIANDLSAIRPAGLTLIELLRVIDAPKAQGPAAPLSTGPSCCVCQVGNGFYGCTARL